MKRVTPFFITALVILCFHFAMAAEGQAPEREVAGDAYLGLQPGLGSLPLLGRGRTRSISAENPTGAKGEGGRAIPNPKEPQTGGQRPSCG